MVSVEVMNYLMEVAVISFVAPVVLLMIWRLRTRKNMIPALTGALMFFVFAMFLAVIPDTVFLGMLRPVAKLLTSNQILYALYTGIVAAILEETARYLAFRYLLPKYVEQRETSVTYGIGHGGIQCMVSYGITNLIYYISCTLLNNNDKLIHDATEELQPYVNEVLNLTVFDCVLDGLSTILLLLLQIGLSIFMFQAYRNPVLCKRLFGFAMLFHVLAYLPEGFYNEGLIPHVLAVILLFIIVALQLYVAVVIYKKMGENEKKLEKERAASNRGWNVAKQKLNNIDEQKEDTSEKK